MSRECYYILVWGDAVALFENEKFSTDRLVLSNVLKRICGKEIHAKVYHCDIIPEAVPHAVRLLKERRMSYSGWFSNRKSFYLSFESWASLRPITGEARRLSDPERLKEHERTDIKLTDKSLKRLEEFYSEMNKTDEDTTSDSVALVHVTVNDTDHKGNKKKESDLWFWQGGIVFIQAEKLLKFPVEERIDLLSLEVEPNEIAWDRLTTEIFIAIRDAEKPFVLFDDEGENQRVKKAPPTPPKPFLRNDDKEIFKLIKTHILDIIRPSKSVYFTKNKNDHFYRDEAKDSTTEDYTFKEGEKEYRFRIGKSLNGVFWAKSLHAKSAAYWILNKDQLEISYKDYIKIRSTLSTTK